MHCTLYVIQHVCTLYLGVLQACKKSKMSILNGKFVFQKLANGEIDKTRVMCIHCAKEFKYHNSVSSLNYHLSAKHALSIRQVQVT